MRKRIIIVVVIVVLFLFFTGCSNSHENLQISPILRVHPMLENYSVRMKIIEISDDELTLQVTNDTPYELMSGVYADLEFFDGENWRTISFLMDRTDPALIWLPSRNETFHVNLAHYATVGVGLYRARKIFFLHEHPREFHDVVAEFYLK